LRTPAREFVHRPQFVHQRAVVQHALILAGPRRALCNNARP
jgi:hypothetical protein